MQNIDKVRQIVSRISMGLFGADFRLRVDEDVKGGGRIFLQVIYDAPCTECGAQETWKGRKFYLSEHMLEQEVIFTAYLAFKLAVEHEIMESFKVDGIILVNPHVNYNRLLEVSQDEIKRAPDPNQAGHKHISGDSTTGSIAS